MAADDGEGADPERLPTARPRRRTAAARVSRARGSVAAAPPAAVPPKPRPTAAQPSAAPLIGADFAVVDEARTVLGAAVMVARPGDADGERTTVGAIVALGEVGSAAGEGERTQIGPAPATLADLETPLGEPDPTTVAPAVVIDPQAAPCGPERDRSRFLVGLGRVASADATPPPRSDPASPRSALPAGHASAGDAGRTPAVPSLSLAEVSREVRLRGLTGFHAVVAAPAPPTGSAFPTWTWAEVRELVLGGALVVLLGVAWSVRSAVEREAATDAALEPARVARSIRPATGARTAETLAPGPTLTVRSEPPDARVLVGGQDEGLTPLVLTASAAQGALLVRVERPGYQPWEAALSPDPSGNYAVQVELVRAADEAL